MNQTVFVANSEMVAEMTVNKVVKKDGRWYVESEEGKNLGKKEGYDTKEAAEKRLKKVEYFKHAKNELVTLKSNVTPSVRNDRMEDKDWLVVPMVMLVEGVHNGSCGALYYPKEELEKTPASWNHKPVVVYHPNGPTACDPDVITNRKVGVIMNTKFDGGKLKAEAWLDPDRIKKIDNRIADAIENKSMMELSTGLFTDLEGPDGDWGQEHYDAIAVNYRPDHLALLPDMKGACSMEDGAGFLRLNSEKEKKTEDRISKLWADTYFPVLRAAGIDTTKLTSNELSHSAVFMQLDGLVRKKNSNAWIEEVFDSFLCYSVNGELFKQEYEVGKDDVITLKNTPEPVVRVVQYKTKSGTFLEVKNDNQDGKEQSMNKDELIKKLLENGDSGWTDKDKEILNSMDEKVLGVIVEKVDNRAAAEAAEKKKAEEEAAKNKAAETKKAETKTESAAVTTTNVAVENKTEPKKPMTEEEYIATAPKNIQNVLTRGLKAYNSEVSRLIKIIKSNPKCSFSDEYLQNRELDELVGLAKIAAPEDKPLDQNSILMPDYSGQAETATANADVEVLDLPVMSFDAK
ncbi:MAG: DUF2213 domain-containing protein [bacterium]|jgi:hypothetical protein|nr:DUF2213 domain-containing protein [bacterium]